MGKLKFIPVKDKIPQVKDWQTSTEDFEITGDRGLVTGLLSDNLEVLDFDLKHEVIKGTLMPAYKEMVLSYDKNLLSRLTVQKTANGGYHFMYRCEEIEGNLKLASRGVTTEEKLISPHLKVMVLIETRGLGGQVVVSPTPGYEIIQGTLETIPTITVKQREILITCARSFNEFVEVVKHQTIPNPSGMARMSPWEDFNLRGDTVSLLESCGWTHVMTKGSKIHFKRPGSTDALTSGNYDTEKNMFSVFSTSTEFDINKGYKPFAVYAMLKHGNDVKAAARDLYNQNYGERNEFKPAEELKPARIVEDDDDFSFLSDESDIGQYLEQVRNNTFELGLCMGSATIDKYLRYKRGNLMMINGSDNVGKTTTIIWLYVQWSKVNGLKWFIYTTENTNGSIAEDVMVFYIGKKLDQCTPEEFSEAKNFFKKHFFLVRQVETSFDYEEVILMARKMISKYSIDGMLIDPFYSVLGDINEQKTSDHAYQYKVIRAVKSFGRMNGVSTYINIHLATAASRKVDADGHMIAPQKSDSEGGNKGSNVADEFITIHRKTQHPEHWMITELHVRKIKERKTGGMVTQMDSPVMLRMNKDFCGFTVIGDEQKYVEPKNSLSERTRISGNDNWVSEQSDTFQDWYSKIEKDDEPAPF
jgi:hypothetical protein